MNKKFLSLLFTSLLLSSLLFVACGQKKGRFAFYISEQSDWSVLRNKLFQPDIFKKYQEPIVFTKGLDIWFSYLPALSRWESTYAISLSKKTLGYNEIDLRNQVLKREREMLIEHYEPLPIGKYLLRIAINNKVIDSIYFEVRADENAEKIDYDAPLPPDEDDNSFKSSEEQDDILKNSK